MKNETPLFKAFTYHNGGQRLRDIADNFGNMAVCRWTVSLVMAAAAAVSGQSPLSGKQGFRELADSVTSMPLNSASLAKRAPVSLVRNRHPARSLEPR